MGPKEVLKSERVDRKDAKIEPTVRAKSEQTAVKKEGKDDIRMTEAASSGRARKDVVTKPTVTAIAPRRLVKKVVRKRMPGKKVRFPRIGAAKSITSKKVVESPASPVKRRRPRYYRPKRRADGSSNKPPGGRGLAEINFYQKDTSFLIPRRASNPLVREIAEGISKDVRLQTGALAAFQEAAEIYLVTLFEDSQLLSCHRRAITVTEKDMRLVLRLRRANA